MAGRDERAPGDQPSAQARSGPHPRQQLEALAYGWLAEPEASVVRAHVAGCPSCQALVADAEAVRERLALLQQGEPRIDVLEQVLRRIESGQ